MQKIWMVMGAAAALASPLVSAQAAVHGLVLPAPAAPSGVTSPNPVVRQSLRALMNADGSVYHNYKFTFGLQFNNLAPLPVDANLFSFPAVSALNIVSASTKTSGFDGMSEYDQAAAGTGIYQGTNYGLEPPDQALAVGNGFVVEAINNALTVYKTDGTVAAAPTPINQFFNAGPEYGGNVSFSDPRAYYDAPTGRFFIEEWETTQDSNGKTVSSAIYLAVSTSSDPTGSYNLYTFDTTLDPALGPNPTTGQPIIILPDYVQIGADANGFYMSINQFDVNPDPNTNQGYVGTRIIAVSKAALVNGASTSVASFSGGDLYNFGFTVQPAKTPKGGAYEIRANGTEYFLSSIYNTTSNQLVAWAITNTKSLTAGTPNLTLTDTVVTSQPFTQPTAAIQKTGPTPYGSSLGYPEELLDSGDTRMTQVTYVLGHLYSAVMTSYAGAPDGINSGFTFFSVAPGIDGAGQVSGLVDRQGYVRVKGETLSYPSFGINSTGGAVITCALVGPDYFPSAAYVPLDSHLRAMPIQISSLGVAPDDGFTGYFNVDGNNNPAQGIARWGDYSQAQADENGAIWMAQEMISTKSNNLRNYYANYGTYITQVKPSGSFSYK